MNKRILILIISLIYLSIGCSTKKNTFVSRTYHNVTSHYNAYFNGNEAYKQGIKRINSNPGDDYSLVLNVFAILNDEAAKQATSDMERAKEKAAIVIKKHSITTKFKAKSNMSAKQKAFYNRSEFCEWVDDSWLLHGKANFVNHDWYAAEENFEYIIKEYTWSNIKFEASIWLALTYIQLTKYDDAKALLDRVDGDKDFPKKYRKMLNQSYAQLYLRQHNYSEAISKLTTAIKFTKKRQEKAREFYILAQLYQFNKQFSKATEYYTAAIKYSNRYELTFNAQINRSTCFETGNAESIRKELFKMLKDDKNIDYFDQIYYAIANLYYKENNVAEALNYYKKSIESTKNNNHQKAVSYMSVGDIYLTKKDYILAQAYFDSSLQLMDINYPEYARVKKLAANLNDLADNLIIIQTEDSLQRIAKMSEKDRNKVIDDIIQKIIEDEKRKQEEEQKQANNMLFINQQSMNPLANQTSGGKWYFYNPSTLAMGMAEFKRKWGSRKLEDDWRRKNKAVVLVAAGEDSTQNQAQNQQQASTNPKQRDFYLKNLPLNDSLMKVSNNKMEEAYFKSGEAAMNQLNDFTLASKQFTTLIERFPKSNYKLLSYYNLYRTYNLIDKQDLALIYKNKIISEFPDSKYAQMLMNPNYLREQEEKLTQIKSLYEEAYDSYKDNDFKSVFSHFNVADSLYKDNPIYPKFKLLKAMSIAKMGKVNEYKNELSEIIEKYPGTIEKQHAEQLLASMNNFDPAYLATLSQNKVQTNNNNSNKTNTQPNIVNVNNSTTQPTENKEETEDAFFSFNENDNCQFIILLDKNADINRLKYNLFGYNIDYFSMFDFQILNGIWNEKYYYIKVFPFGNYKEAVKYYKHVNKNQDAVFRGINEKHYQFFVISDPNYLKLQSSGEIERYQKFFKRKFLKKKAQ
ncbi:MAG TPA: tetratricopeptide repeat protein [Bacteroidales bacterium]|nr:tetratricopeptide repeat protein [Bacteroidales bacterium]